jgi:hypothetical protein
MPHTTNPSHAYNPVQTSQAVPKPSIDQSISTTSDDGQVHTIAPESNDPLKAPVIRTANNKLVCEPKANDHTLTLDDNGVSEGLDGETIQVVHYDGFTRFEWSRNTGKVAAIIVNDSLYGLVNRTGWLPQISTNLPDLEWGGRVDKVSLTICSAPTSS